jgi:hypothetical protein
MVGLTRFFQNHVLPAKTLIPSNVHAGFATFQKLHFLTARKNYFFIGLILSPTGKPMILSPRPGYFSATMPHKARQHPNRLRNTLFLNRM